MLGEPGIAVGRFEPLAAGPAKDKRRIASPVEEEQRLLPGGDGLVQRLLQALAEQRLVAPVQLQAEIDHFDRG